MANARYFQLRDEHGIEPSHLIDPDTLQPVENPRAGELQPLRDLTLTLGVPTMIDGRVVSVPQSVTVRAIPGTRILKVDDGLTANAVATIGLYSEIDPPTKRDLDQARKATEPARERPASGNPDQPLED